MKIISLPKYRSTEHVVIVAERITHYCINNAAPSQPCTNVFLDTGVTLEVFCRPSDITEQLNAMAGRAA